MGGLRIAITLVASTAQNSPAPVRRATLTRKAQHPDRHVASRACLGRRLECGDECLSGRDRRGLLASACLKRKGGEDLPVLRAAQAGLQAGDQSGCACLSAGGRTGSGGACLSAGGGDWRCLSFGRKKEDARLESQLVAHRPGNAKQTRGAPAAQSEVNRGGGSRRGAALGSAESRRWAQPNLGTGRSRTWTELARSAPPADATSTNLDLPKSSGSERQAPSGRTARLRQRSPGATLSRSQPVATIRPYAGI